MAQLTNADLIDEYHLVVNAIVLGRGRTLFESVEKRLRLPLKTSRAFSNGNVVPCHEPQA